MLQKMKYVQPAELRKILDISEATYHRLFRIKGGLPTAIRVGSRVRFLEADVKLWVEQNKI